MFSALKIVYYLGVILISTKLFGLLARKIGLPQVVGMVVAGLVIGSSIIGNFGWQFRGLIDPSAEDKDVLSVFSQIGVILILFSSGLETDVKELRKTGFAATLIALCGVIVPIILGTLLSMAFMGNDWNNQGKVLNAVFVGMILTATSVGITVETLRELGKLSSRVGTVILSAAIIDDVLGIIALSILTSVSGGGNPLFTVLKTLGFFAAAIGVGFLLRLLFKWMGAHSPHTRRNGIFAFGVCFLYAFCAERFFGVAAITGAYVCGLMLSGLHETKYIDRKVLVSGYIIFTPIFFAFIGINADFSHFNWFDLVFGLAFVAVGILGKIIGCSLSARACGFKKKEPIIVGFGMIARGEVALAVYSTGKNLIYFEEGVLVGIDPLVGVILLIVISSILCPVFLKLLFKDHTAEELPEEDRVNLGENAMLKEGGYHSENASANTEDEKDKLKIMESHNT